MSLNKRKDAPKPRIARTRLPVCVVDEESAKADRRVRVVHRCASVAEAEAWIEEAAKGNTDTLAKVERGGYGIDAPEEMVNPPRGGLV